MARPRPRWLLAASLALVAAGSWLVVTLTAFDRYPPAHFFTPDGPTAGDLYEVPSGEALPGWGFRVWRKEMSAIGPELWHTFSRESLVAAWLDEAGLRPRPREFTAVWVRSATFGDSRWSEWVRTDRLGNDDFTPAADLVGVWQRRRRNGEAHMVELRAAGQMARFPDGAGLGWWGARGDVLLTDEWERGSSEMSWAVLSENRRRSVDESGDIWSRVP